MRNALLQGYLFFSICTCSCTVNQLNHGKCGTINRLEAGLQQTIVFYGTSLTKGGAWVRQLAAILYGNYNSDITLFNEGYPGQNSQWGINNLQNRVISHSPD